MFLTHFFPFYSDCAGGDDERNCNEHRCKDWQFACNDGKCIFQTWTCDGEFDCDDHSDELNCGAANSTASAIDDTEAPLLPPPVFPRDNCNDWMFKCNSGQCIPYWWKCDNTEDCDDGSDEVECSDEDDHQDVPPLASPGTTTTTTQVPPLASSCAPTKFQCPSGECIWQMWVCDGDEDCDGGEDEAEEICKDRVTCLGGQFRCERSGQCVDYEKVCNGVDDCTDGSDETGCGNDDEEEDHHHDQCRSNEFSCDDGICLSQLKMCDGHLDCLDETDELHCASVNANNVQVKGLTVESEEITSSSVRVDWWIADIGDTNAIEYQPAYAIHGSTDNWKFKDWTTIADFKYTFTDLYPYTKYNFKLNVRYHGQLHLARDVVTATTSPDFPGPPHLYNVTQVGTNVHLKWTPPAKPNGILRYYIVKMYRVDANRTLDDDVRDMEALRTWHVSVTEGENLVVDGSLMKPQTSYAFVVAASNTDFLGEYSKPQTLVYDKNSVLTRVESFKAINVKESRLRLMWTKPKIEKKIEESEAFSKLYRFKIAIKSDNLIATYDDVIVDSDAEFVDVKGLSPDTGYTFSIAPFDGTLSGPPSRVQVRTPGKKLPRPNINDAIISAQSANAIKLTWTLEADEKRKEGWQFGVFYGLKQSDLSVVRNVTHDTSFTVTGLESCESYTFVVAVVGSGPESQTNSGRIGSFGPPSPFYSKATKYSAGAPPKHLKAVLEDDTTIVLSWDASCPTVGDGIGYEITIRDSAKAFNHTVKLSTVKKVPSGDGEHQEERPTSDASFRQVFSDNVRYGATYTFWVRTDSPGSKSAGPIQISTEAIPAPSALTSRQDVKSSSHVVMWTSPQSLPSYIRQDPDTSYTVFLSRTADMQHVVKNYSHIQGNLFDLPMKDLEPGRLYFMAVQFVDGGGYTSAMTPAVAIESPVPDDDVVVSSSNLAGVIVFICFVILVLGAGFSYYFVKHRRLRRGLQEFASRYSPASGAANIFNNGTLLVDHSEDDTAPIIRGFADDEPLVMNT